MLPAEPLGVKSPVFVIPRICYLTCFVPGLSDHLPCVVHSADGFGTWISVHGDGYHLTTEEDSIPVDHCDPRDVQPP